MTYFPKIRLRKKTPTNGAVTSAPLFPTYVFIRVELQWWSARWCPGVIRLINAGGPEPARVPDAIINSLHAREVGGLIELPERPTFLMRPYSESFQIRITKGVFTDYLAIYAVQRPQERVAVLQLLGAPREIELSKAAITTIPSSGYTRSKPTPKL